MVEYFGLSASNPAAYTLSTQIWKNNVKHLTSFDGHFSCIIKFWGFIWICCLDEHVCMCVCAEVWSKSVCFERIGILSSHWQTKQINMDPNFRLLFLAQGLIDSGIPCNCHTWVHFVLLIDRYKSPACICGVMLAGRFACMMISFTWGNDIIDVAWSYDLHHF